ncbi:MAG: response regulator [Bacillota bacterium]|nr:response regulator [Bacillota bacterium]
MYSLLIVDDQRIVREGICTMLDQLNLEIPAVYHASDSQSAIRMINKHQPDMILLDIVMPGEDGFSVVQYINNHKIATNIIIVTSYDEFDYAVKAIKYNVKDFLLKPINQIELYQALYKIMHSQTDEPAENKLFYNILLISYLEGKSTNVNTVQLFEQTGLSLMEGEQVRVLNIFDSSTDQKAQKILESFPQSFQAKYDSVIYSPKSERELVLIFPDRNWINGGENYAKSMIRGGAFHIGISESGPLQRLRLLYRESVEARSYLQENQITNTIIHFSQEDMIRYLIQRTTHPVSEAIKANDESRVHEIIDVLFQQLTIVEDNKRTIKKELMDWLDQLNREGMLYTSHNSEDCFASNTPVRTLLHLKALTLEAIKQIAVSRQLHHDAPVIVRRMVDYVNQNYCKPISLGVLANELNINYNHASSLFNRHIGMNFSDYLNQLRLEKAAELLKHGEVRILEAARRSGFSNTKYFFRKFKAYYHMTPGEYQKHHVNI